MAEPARAPSETPDPAPDRWLRKAAADPAERVPLLAEAMAAAATAWSASFCGLSATEGEFTFKGLRAVRVADLPLREMPLPIFAALRVPGWDAVAGLSLDREVVSIVVEAFFGGDGDPKPDTRPVSPVEMRIVDVIGGQSATALSAALSAVQPVRVEFDRTLPKPDRSFLGKLGTPLLAATFELRTMGRAATLDVLFPQAAIDAQGSVFAGEAPRGPVLDDAGWTRRLRTEVSRATMQIEAVIAMRPLSLGDLLGLKVGQVLELPAGAAAGVQIRCGEEALFRCDLGQSAGFYTVRVDTALEREPQPSRKDR